MNIVISPTLDGLASERLRAFATQLASLPADEPAIRNLTRTKTAWALRTPLLNGQTRAYEAAVRLLADLCLLKWKVRADACGIELESPSNSRRQAATPEEIRAAKDDIRRELAPALAAQFSDPLVRGFIADLEQPPRGSRRQSIRHLIADGAEVFARLQPALAAAHAVIGIAALGHRPLVSPQRDQAIGWPVHPPVVGGAAGGRRPHTTHQRFGVRPAGRRFPHAHRTRTREQAARTPKRWRAFGPASGHPIHQPPGDAPPPKPTPPPNDPCGRTRTG